MAESSNAPRLLDDQPEATVGHLWTGMDAFAQRLSSLLPCLPSGYPVLITGPWGSGKTTLLRAVQARLEAERSDGKPRTIWFEAWRHESVELLLPALVRTVWSASPRQEAKRALLRTALRAATVVASAVHVSRLQLQAVRTSQTHGDP